VIATQTTYQQTAKISSYLDEKAISAPTISEISKGWSAKLRRKESLPGRRMGKDSREYFTLGLTA